MRKGLIAIIVIVLAVVGYVAGVITTKKATYQAIEALVEEVERSAQFQVDVDVDWQEQGARKATVVFNVNLKDLEDVDFPVSYEETIELTYGFLNTKWEGRGDIQIEDRNLSDILFSGNRFTSSGVVSRGGLRVTYDFPTSELQEDDFTVSAQPMQMHFVMAGEERRFHFQVPELELADMNQQSLAFTELLITGDTRMLDGEVFSSESKISLANMELNLESFGTPIQATGYYSTLNTLRADEELRLDGIFGLESFDAGPTVKGNARFDWALSGLDYNAIMVLNEALNRGDLESEEIDEYFYSALIASDDIQLRINEFLVSAEGWGDFSSSGTVGFNISELSDAQKRTVFESPEAYEYIAADFVVEEMPGMLQMMLMAFTSESLPWQIRVRDGVLYINDELVDLSAL
ncbi:hypothetical protein CWE08_00475 [Aliidiomarina iranensis]|uniref:DUF945 domain-containing protein n=1 Tax=Aliidiomarina iranensis TaxID=1434071 RepID=A0A432W1R7_9GAMM|nr:DUF945 family protein [Aliidiomarina iranensis]RUO23165.1 hypothetical protein CWE08_00475 [Aliidiomarina iranensis]